MSAIPASGIPPRPTFPVLLLRATRDVCERAQTPARRTHGRLAHAVPYASQRATSSRPQSHQPKNARTSQSIHNPGSALQWALGLRALSQGARSRTLLRPPYHLCTYLRDQREDYAPCFGPDGGHNWGDAARLTAMVRPSFRRLFWSGETRRQTDTPRTGPVPPPPARLPYRRTAVPLPARAVPFLFACCLHGLSLLALALALERPIVPTPARRERDFSSD